MKMLPKKKFATLSDIAKVAGVSVSVAGAVVNGSRKGNSRASEATRQSILAAARDLGYKPLQAARQLRGSLTNTYGILVASAGDPLRSFLIEHLDMGAVSIGHHTVICNTKDEDGHGDRFLSEAESLKHRRVDGVFCAVLPWWPGDREALLELHPNTVFFEDPGIPGAAVVAPDRGQAVSLGLRHLFDRGRRSIGLLVQNKSSATGRARTEAFEDECRILGIPFRSDLIFDADQREIDCGHYDGATGTWSFPVEVAEAAVEHLVVKGKADAILAHNDFWASVCLRNLRARGLRVPDQVAVIGYLNHYLADWTDPPLSSISPGYLASAQAMIKTMRELIDGEGGDEVRSPIMIEPRFVQRAST